MFKPMRAIKSKFMLSFRMHNTLIGVSMRKSSILILFFTIILVVSAIFYYIDNNKARQITTTSTTINITTTAQRFIFPPLINGFTISVESTFPSQFASPILSNNLSGSYMATYINISNENNSVLLRLLKYSNPSSAYNAYEYIINITGAPNTSYVQCNNPYFSSGVKCIYVNQYPQIYSVSYINGSEVFTASFSPQGNITNQTQIFNLLINMIHKAYISYISSS